MRLLLDSHVLVWYPFDRLRVAQSRIESLRLLTDDKLVALYGEPVVLVG